VALTSYDATPRRATYVPLARMMWSYSVDVDGRCRPFDHLCREVLVGTPLGSNCQGEGRGFESRRPLEELGAIVLHYDADFDLIGSVTGQRCQWVVPPGSTP